MKKHVLYYTSAALSLIFLGGCMHSLVYSPGLSLSDRAVKKHQVDATAGIGLLPETRPQVYGNASLGATAKLAYGITDKFNLYGSGWIDLSDNYWADRGGFSLHSRIVLRENEHSRFELIPKIGILTDEVGISVYGLGTDVIYLENINPRLYHYLGLGLMAGAERINRLPSRNSNVRNYYGYGIVGHLGLGYNISPEWRAVIDLNPIYQVNPVERRQDFILSPSLTFGYRIGW